MPRSQQPAKTGLAGPTNAAAAVFALVLLKINHRLFHIPINEYFDYAANTLLIEQAKHFRLLLGNYSRWGFHHPGPAFLYIFAAGETLLYHWLHIVPAVMNAYLVTIILLNCLFVFGTIAIIAQHCKTRLFLPAAIVLAIYFVYVVNRTIPGSALTSIWMPYVLLFCFLLFATLCASVAAGNIRQLPLLALTGLMLLHGHVAQPLFVGPLAALAVVAVLLTQASRSGLKHFLRVNRIPLLLSLVLVVVFALPIVLDASLHKPSNLHQILAHTAEYPGAQKPWGQALKYEISFFTFLPHPEDVLQSASAHLVARGAAHPYIVVYWCFGFLLAALTAGTLLYQRKRPPIFLSYLAAEIVVIMLLFLFWGTRISGPLYSFNGYFFYAVQLLILLGMMCFLLNEVTLTVRWETAAVLACAAPLLMLAGKSAFRTTEIGWPETDRLVAALPADLGPVQVSNLSQDWLEVLGLVSHLKRVGHPYCVGDAFWGLFEDSPNCPDMRQLHNLILTRVPRTCEAPCRTLEQDDRFALQVEPYPWLQLPLQLEGYGASSVNQGFYYDSWGTHSAAIRFLLRLGPARHGKVHVKITGVGVAGRPTDVFLNGVHLGPLAAGSSVTEFVVDANVLRPGAENTLRFQTENAGPIVQDWRELGYKVQEVEVFEAPAN